MRAFTATTLGLVSLLHLAASQSLSDLPACATTCALNAIGSTGCAVTDATCICSNTGFLAGVQTCISTACSAADQQATLAFAQAFCLTGGVTITLPTGSAIPPATSSAAAPASSSSSAPASVAATTTTAVAPSTTQSPSTFTGAAAVLKHQHWSLMGVLGLGVAAVL